MERGGVTGIEGNDSIRACGFDVYSVIAPLSVLGPADIELVGFRGKGDRAFVVEVGDVLGIGDTDGFIGPEVPEIRRGVRALVVGTLIEFSAAVIGAIAMVGNTLAAEIEVGALNSAGDDLRASFID